MRTLPLTSFELFISTTITITVITIFAELTYHEQEARQLMAASVMRSGQFDHLEALCTQKRLHKQRLCRTSLYWIENQTWVEVCSTLSQPKTRPLRWFLVQTDCHFSASGPFRDLTIAPFSLVHWLAKS